MPLFPIPLLPALAEGLGPWGSGLGPLLAKAPSHGLMPYGNSILGQMQK